MVPLRNGTSMVVVVVIVTVVSLVSVPLPVPDNEVLLIPVIVLDEVPDDILLGGAVMLSVPLGNTVVGNDVRLAGMVTVPSSDSEMVVSVVIGAIVAAGRVVVPSLILTTISGAATVTVASALRM
jgi:hypothetical protein